MLNETDSTSKEELINFSRQRSLTETENHDKFIESIQGKQRRITVEPLMLMFVVIMYFQNVVMGQYIYYRVGKDLNLTTENHLAYVCNRNATGGYEKEKTNKLQNIYTYNTMLIQISSSICTIITAPFYCVFSDRFGRKVMFLLPGIGVTIKSVIEVMIIIYDWPIKVFIITEGFYGLFGGFNFATGLSYSYIADISTQKARTRRMAELGILMAIGALIVSLSSGFWIKFDGYLSPYAFTVGVAFLCFLYPIFLLKEPLKMNNSQTENRSAKDQFKSLFTIYWYRPKWERALLIIILVIFNFYYVSEMSGISLSGTYLMSYPICMNTIQMSIFGFANMLAINIGVVITVVVLTRCFTDLFLILICLLSGIAFSLQMSFAANPISVFIAASSNLFSFSAFPFIRGHLSKRMGPHEQGALFGSLALSETVCGAITKVIVIYFYRETFEIFHGMVYMLITSFSIVAIILTLIAIPISKKIKLEETLVNVN